MSLNYADKSFIRDAVREEVNRANARVVAQLSRVLPRGLIHTAVMATCGFLTATLILDVKNKSIPHISYPLAEAERWLVEISGQIAIWTGGFMADYNRMYPSRTIGQSIIGLTNAQSAAFAAAMRERESSDNYREIHEFGYLGGYGMGAGALADIGYIDRTRYERAPAAVKNGSNRAQHLAFLQDNRNWVRYSFDEFMNNNGVQDQAFLDLVNLNIKRGFKGGALKRGDHKRIAGFAAAAHLVGYSGAVKYYGANIDDNDRYGTKASEYARLGENSIKGSAPADTGARPDGLPMDKKYYTRTSSGFGKRTLNGKRSSHGGIDFPVPAGTPVKATADGKVVYAGNYAGSCGYGVKIQHGTDYATVFCHLSRIDARRNEWIRKGAIIGLSGGIPGTPGAGKSTGAHIHYAVKVNGTAIDPLLFIPQLSSGKIMKNFAVRPQQLPIKTVASSNSYWDATRARESKP